MDERIPGNKLSNVPEENDALTELTAIERQVARGDTGGAKVGYQILTQKLDQRFMRGKNSSMTEDIEDRLTALRIKIFGAPNPTSGDET